MPAYSGVDLKSGLPIFWNNLPILLPISVGDSSLYTPTYRLKASKRSVLTKRLSTSTSSSKTSVEFSANQFNCLSLPDGNFAYSAAAFGPNSLVITSSATLSLYSLAASSSLDMSAVASSSAEA